MAFIVGLGHQKFVGKDTAALGLIEQLGFVRCALADAGKKEMCVKLRKTLKEIVRLYSKHHLWPHERDVWFDDEAYWDDRLRRLLWIDKPIIVVRLMQEYMTEIMRTIDPYYWVNKLAKEILDRKYEKVVITDLRFKNEANWIHLSGGLCLKITKKDISQEASDHLSEQELADWKYWDAVCPNDGTVAQLHEMVCSLVKAKLDKLGP